MAAPVAICAAFALSLFSGCTTLVPRAKTVVDSRFGYAIDGENVLFRFSPKDYSVATNGKTGEWRALKSLGEPKKLAVAGPFNSWNPETASMEPDGASGFVLAMPVSGLLKYGVGIQFKFVIDGLWWVEPPATASNRIATGFSNNASNLILYPPEAKFARNPRDLDQLWNAYFTKNDQAALDRILQVMNWNDSYRERINLSLKGGLAEGSKSNLIAALGNASLSLGADDSVRSPMDLDIFLFLLQNDRRYGPAVKEIEVIIGDQNELEGRCAVKAAAFWSLVANSRQHAEVREYVLKCLPTLKAESRNMLFQQLNVNRSSDGSGI